MLLPSVYAAAKPYECRAEWWEAHQVRSMSWAGPWKASTLLMLELASSTLAAQYRLFQLVT